MPLHPLNRRKHMSKKRTYPGQDVTVSYELVRCIHAAECAHGLPDVFDPAAKPWVNPDAASADQVAAVIHRCPTGALTYTRTDGGPAEAPPAVNTITVAPDGPLYVHGEVALATTAEADPAPEIRMALCRCGASQHKPFCDNSHLKAEFTHPGTLGTSKLASEPAADGGTLRITPSANGPLILQGPFELRSADGQTVCSGEKAALCRCGASQNKPFCDGSHRSLAFVAA